MESSLSVIFCSLLFTNFVGVPVFCVALCSEMGKVDIKVLYTFEWH